LRREPANPVIYIAGGLMQSAEDLLEHLRYRLEPQVEWSEVASRIGAAAQSFRTGLSVAPPPSGNPVRQLTGSVTEIQRLLGDQGEAVVIVDEFPDPLIAHTLFGRLRDEIWRLPITWVVTGAEGDRATYLRPPADAFFEQIIELGPLGADMAKALLERRLGAPDELSDDVIDQLIAASNGNPRRLLKLARDTVIDGVSPSAALSRSQARDDAASQIGDPAAQLIAELEANGPASASDAELLARMGWTRGRAAQVFKSLEQSGLVKGFTSVGGRRKLYALQDQEAS